MNGSRDPITLCHTRLPVHGLFIRRGAARPVHVAAPSTQRGREPRGRHRAELLHVRMAPRPYAWDEHASLLSIRVSCVRYPLGTPGLAQSDCCSDDVMSSFRQSINDRIIPERNPTAETARSPLRALEADRRNTLFFSIRSRPLLPTWALTTRCGAGTYCGQGLV